MKLEVIMTEIERENTINKIKNPIEYITSIIVKEAKHEERLVRQLLYAMLSAYTNNPMNLGINSPSGEGKKWVLKKVAEKFPSGDITFLSHMSERALFHRKGTLVYKDGNGDYAETKPEIKHIDKQIKKYQDELDQTPNTEGDKREKLD